MLEINEIQWKVDLGSSGDRWNAYPLRKQRHRHGNQAWRGSMLAHAEVTMEWHPDSLVSGGFLFCFLYLSPIFLDFSGTVVSGNCGHTFLTLCSAEHKSICSKYYSINLYSWTIWYTDHSVFLPSLSFHHGATTLARLSSGQSDHSSMSHSVSSSSLTSDESMVPALASLPPFHSPLDI